MTPKFAIYMAQVLDRVDPFTGKVLSAQYCIANVGKDFGDKYQTEPGGCFYPDQGGV